MRLLRPTFLVLLTLAISLNAQTIDPKAIDALMLRTMKEWKIPGAAVAIVKDGRIAYVQGYGTKELGGTDRVSPDTLFQIASNSKAFTSTSLAMLASDGKLSFDDPVRAHLDYFHLSDACADANVTIRDIVTHRTGLSRHDELWDNTPATREDVIRSMAHVALTKPFRTTYQYQNITFIAAGEIVAKAAGMSWDEFVRTRIFQPLRMSSTVTTDAEWKASTNRAAGHQYDWRTGVVSAKPQGDTTTIGPAGAVKTSAKDMANWVLFQLGDGTFDGRKLVDAELLEETKSPHTVMRMSEATREDNPFTNVMSYAMGWKVQDYRGELLVSHAGALNGFRAHVGLLPHQKSGFALMINVGRGIALFALRNALSDMLLGVAPRDWNAHYLASDRKQDEKSAADRVAMLAKRTPNTTPTLPLPSYAGEYRNPAYGTARVTLENEKLVLRWNRLTIPLDHYHYDVFNAYSEPDEVDEQITFTLGSDHTLQSMTLFGETFVK